MTAPPPVGSWCIAQVVPRGTRRPGTVASAPYRPAQVKARRLLQARLQGPLRRGDFPSGKWVTVKFLEGGCREVPLKWVRPTKGPPPPKPTTSRKGKKKK